MGVRVRDCCAGATSAAKIGWDGRVMCPKCGARFQPKRVAGGWIVPTHLKRDILARRSA